MGQTRIVVGLPGAAASSLRIFAQNHGGVASRRQALWLAGLGSMIRRALSAGTIQSDFTTKDTKHTQEVTSERIDP